MKTTHQLSQVELNDAIKQYVERETGDKVVQNGVRIKMEHDHVTVTVKTESKQK